MLACVKVEIDGGTRETELEVTERGMLHMANEDLSVVAVALLGRCCGQVIAALAAGSSVTVDHMLEEFQRSVETSARPTSAGRMS